MATQVPPEPPQPPASNPGKARPRTVFSCELDRSQARKVGLALEELTKLEGWQYLIAAHQTAVQQTAFNALRDGHTPREYYAGIVDGLETFLGYINAMIGEARAIVEQDSTERKVLRGVF